MADAERGRGSGERASREIQFASEKASPFFRGVYKDAVTVHNSKNSIGTHLPESERKCSLQTTLTSTRNADARPTPRTNERIDATRRDYARVDTSSKTAARGNADPLVGHVVHARETARGGCV